MAFKFYALWLCLICIGVFFLQLFIPGFTDLFILDANAYHQVWRLLTAIFLHAGTAHLIANLFALALFGSLLEGVVGGKRFLIIFFVSGILANFIALYAYPSSLGASGAIFGVIGTLAVMRPFLVVWAFGLPMPLIVAAAIWVIGDAIGVFVPSGIGHIAHLSGVIVGIIFGFLWKKKGTRTRRQSLHLDDGLMRSWENHYLR
ncbi:rhomboid family intramembrane serine protease [Candidatus Pacearchaeota archaeon]|nr:rhomboid family intramembrane serine protease [Candidatus Pacearchaeota archaeon]